MTVGKIWVAVACFFCVVPAALADDKQPEKQQKIVSDAEQVKRAKFIDFASELGLPLASLDSLGERIDNARLKGDPVELASIAKVLAAAESAAGKKASLTSDQIAADAVALAKERANLAGLATVAKLVDEAAAKELQAVAQAIKDQATTENEESRDLHGVLIVANRAPSGVHVFVRGYELGYVPPFNTRAFHVGHAHGAYARDHFGHHWRASFQFGHYHQYVWVINNPHHPHFHFH